LVGAKLQDAVLRSANLGPAKLDDSNRSAAALRGAQIVPSNLTGAILTGANLNGATLVAALLNDADLSDATMLRANLESAEMRGAVLRRTDLEGVNLNSAVADGAVFVDANLASADFTHTRLEGADFSSARIRYTVIATDMTVANGLESVKFDASSPSYIGHSFLLKETRRAWPEQLLRACGLSDREIEFARAVRTTPLQFFSSFISYSSKDSAFALRLHAALEAKGIPCWLDRYEILPGDNVAAAITDAVRLADKVLLCCSRNSLAPSSGWWVGGEVDRALQKERFMQKERDRETLVLIPLNLDGFLFDPACLHEHTAILVKRHAADFVGWENDPAVFDSQLVRVVKALRTDAFARTKLPPPKL
jgi:uncharacterized protein YjbI with pentapeptide repeats